MGQVKAGSVKGEMHSAWRVEDFTINTLDRKSQMSVQSGPWDWAMRNGKVVGGV